MKKNIAILSLLMVLTSCGPSVSTKDMVNIRELSANATPTSSQTGLQSLSRNISKNLKNDGDNQAVLLYDYESIFYLTITLENPKAETIDAIQLTSYDPSAKVFVDGSYKPIHYDNGSRIVNWSQEDPYEKVIQINSSLNNNENFVEITDLKVNGKWQNEELHNNTLYIRRVAQNGFSFSQIHNSFKDYKFKFNTDENVSDIRVDGAVKNQDGTYSAKQNGRISWTFKYNVDGISYLKGGHKDITLLKVVDTYNYYTFLAEATLSDGVEASLASFRHTLGIVHASPSFYRLWVKIIGGTDVDKSSITLTSGEDNFVFNLHRINSTPGYDCFTFGEAALKNLKDNVVLKVGGMEYNYTKDELLVPSNAHFTEDWFFDLA